MKSLNNKSKLLLFCVLGTIFMIVFLCSCAKTANEKPIENNNWSNEKCDTSKIFDNNVYVDNENYKLKSFYYLYPNNTYVSLTDFSYLLKDSIKAFNCNIEKKQIKITTKNIDKSRILPAKSSNDNLVDLESSAISIYIDDNLNKSFGVLVNMLDNNLDAYIQVSELCMLLNINVEMDSNNTLKFVTNKDYALDFHSLDDARFAEDINSVLVKNLNDDKVLYDHNSNNDYAIASTSKIMVYLLTMEALKENKLDYDTKIPFTKQAEDISKSADGVINIKENDTITVKDLLNGLLIASSNECACTIAAYLAGSEEEFVKQMQDKANQLKLDSAVFYNSSGLPVFTKSIVSAKCQNKMSANDMYTLVKYVLDKFPEIKDITSLKEAYLSSIDKKISSTNRLLWDADGVDGLKTGTSNKAGSSIILHYKYKDQNLLILLYGCENSEQQLIRSKLIIKCIQNYYN